MNNRSSPFSIFALLSLALLLPLRAADDATGPTNASPSDVAPSTNAVPAPEPRALTSNPAATAPAERPATYTVVSGDTLWDLSHKFNTSIRQLKKLNNLKKNNLKPGQVLKIPPAKTHGTASTGKPASHSKKAKSVAIHHAQPVQDFDLPASNFASCPVPIPSDEVDEAPAVKKTAHSSALATTQASEETAPQASTAPPQIALFHAHRYGKDSTLPESPSAPTLSYSAPAAKPEHHGFFNFFYTPPPAVDWSAKFTELTRDLSSRGLAYDDDWCPPGESHSWSMDCSNTTRYLYRAATGIQLPRTASDQYYYLHLQNKAWDVPQLASGFADCNYLRQNLKPGDLLFWENTYRPERQPPITHVMIFVGTNARGEWLMAGSQSSRGGEHNRPHGGPDIYVFNPTRPCGGYTTWLGFVHHQGRFCAFGRPLEADKAKLAVAAND